MGHDQVSEGVSVLCFLAEPVAMFYGNLPEFGNKVKIGNKVLFGNKFTNLCNVWLIKVSLYIMAMSQNVMLHLEEGDFIIFDEIPISTIKLPEGRFQTFSDISLSEKLRCESCRP